MASIDIIELETCPKCEAGKLRRKGGKLVCSSKNCDYSEEIFGKKSESWLLETRENAELWNRVFFDEYPTPISHEYHRLFLMARHNQIFPMVYQLMDVMELLLKYPVLCAAAYIRDDEISKLLVEKLISLGDWQRIADKICEKKAGQYTFDIPAELRSVIEDIRAVYDDKKVVQKRNEFIGHSALGFEDNPAYRDYCTVLMNSAAEHLVKTRAAYSEMKLMVGEQELTGWRKAELLNADAEAYVILGGKAVMLSPFMVDCGDGLYLYDSYDGRKEGNTGSWLNYIKGGPKRSFEYRYFADVYKRNKGLFLEEQIDISNVMGRGEVDAELDRLNSADIYSCPEDTVKWLQQALEDDSGCVLHLIMERGMGKSAFCYALESHSINLNNTQVCVYYCSDTQIRGVNSFSAGINTALTGDLTEHISGIKPRLDDKGLTTQEQRSKRMTEALNFFRRNHEANHQKRKLLLVIDGLDEIPEESIAAFDFIPYTNNMPDNCYLLLTSRNPSTEILSKHIIETINTLHFRVKNTRIVFPTDPENIASMKHYIDKRCKVLEKKGSRKLSEKEIHSLLKKSAYSFLNLRLYILLLDSGYPIKEILSLDSKNILEYYLNDIKRAYGNKLYEEAFPILLLIGTAFDPLTIKEIAYLGGQSFVTLKLRTFLKDFGALLKAERSSYRGTRYMIASERYKDYIDSTYSSQLLVLADEYIDLLASEFSLEYDENEPIEISDEVIYLASSLTRFIMRYGNPEAVFKACKLQLWEKMHYIGSNMNTKHNSDIERKINCLSGALELLLSDTDNSYHHDDYYLSILYTERGQAYSEISRYDEALSDYQKTIEISERMFREGILLYNEMDIAKVRFASANILYHLNRYDEALSDYDRAIEIMDRLYKEGRLHDENYIATARMNRATTLDSLTRYDEALADYDRAIEVRERLFNEGKLHDENYIATARSNRAVTLKALTRYDDALADEDRAIEIMERLSKEKGLHDENDIATALMNRGLTYYDMGLYDDALANYDKAIEIASRLLVEGRLTDEHILATSRMNRSNILYSMSRYEEALEDINKDIWTLEQMLYEGTLQSKDEPDLAYAQINRAIIYETLTRYDDALADYDSAIEIMERLFNEGKLHDENYIAMALLNRAITYHATGRYDEALADAKKAIGIYESLIASGKTYLSPALEQAKQLRNEIAAKINQ